MGKRTRVAINCIFSGYWVAGTYYTLNLIHALKQLENHKKPVLVFYNLLEEHQELIREIGYPYIEFLTVDINYSLPVKLLNAIAKRLTGKHIYEKRPTDKDIAAVFPLGNKSIFYDLVTNQVFWLADFQHHYYPQYFSQEDVQKRKKNEEALSLGKKIIVFSSEDSRNDFLKFYPTTNTRSVVMNFAVTHADYSKISFSHLQDKFDIRQAYFFIPNQFWIHKNHSVVLKAVKLLAEEGLCLLIVFTGSPQDYRNPDHYPSLLKYVEDHHLGKYFRFLGFIAREEQLCLMNNADCVVQPSLFEGWSTSIEDAKCMNKYIIASDLPVHKEQIPDNVVFFERNSEQHLASVLKDFLVNPPAIKMHDYRQDVLRFAKKFTSLLKSE